jgi:hypothetical protein
LPELKFVFKRLIINKILVEAAGVELFSVLTARNFIDPSYCQRGKKGTIAESIVRVLYENLSEFP